VAIGTIAYALSCFLPWGRRCCPTRLPSRGAQSGQDHGRRQQQTEHGAAVFILDLRLSNEDLQEAREVIRNAQVLVLQNEVLEATNVVAAQLAKSYRVRVILNRSAAYRSEPD
jgi:hypothetical protein